MARMKRRPQKRTLLEIAVHEAGHAVAKIKTGQACNGVTIVPGDGYAGSTGGEFGTKVGADGIEYIMDETVIMLLAGHSAVSLKWPELADCERGQWGDMKDAEHFAEMRLPEFRESAERLVRENWAHIEAVAQCLLEEKKLSGDDVEIIVEAVDQGIAWRTFLSTYR